MLTLLKNINKKQVLFAVLFIAALFGAGYLGRVFFPEIKTETKIVTKEKIVERVVVVRVKEKQKNLDKSTITWYKDGTIQQEKLTLNVNTKETEQTNKDTTSTSQTEQTTKTETNKTEWKVGVLAGIDTRNVLKTEEGTLQFNMPPLTYGAQVERRVVGPFWLGAWGTTNGGLGLSVSASF